MGKTHSALGIASFAISFIAAFELLATVVVVGMLQRTTPGGPCEYSPVPMFFMAGIGTEVVAFALGITEVFQKDRKRVFAILGIVFSLLTLLGILSIIVLIMMITVAISP